MKHNPYDAYRYDANFALKLTPLLWLIIIWSTHHTLLLAMSALAKSDYVFDLVRNYAASVPMLMSDIPGAIILITRLNRSPEAGAKIRWLWRHGIKFLVLGLSISTVATFQHYQQEITNPENTVFWIEATNLGFIAYLIWSRQAREIFADFPSPDLAAKDDKPAQRI